MHSATVIDELSYNGGSVWSVDCSHSSPSPSTNPSLKICPPSSNIQSVSSGNPSSKASSTLCSSARTSGGSPEPDGKLEAASSLSVRVKEKSTDEKVVH